MIVEDEESLICDLAETYKIYDYRQLPLSLVAVFACGLKDDSRIKLKLSKQRVKTETMLLAGILDRLSILIWLQTKDGQKGTKKPNMMVDILVGKEHNNSDVVVFTSGKDFEILRENIIRKLEEGEE